MSIDKNLELLKKTLIYNNPNLFLGAGFSLGATRKNKSLIPSGNEFKKIILTELLHHSEGSPEYNQLIKITLPKLCTYTETKIGKVKFNLFFKEIFQDTKPALFHYSFAKYPWDKIFTTNIDDILESVYKQSHRDCIIQNQKFCSTKPRKNETEIFKLHGCVNKIEDGIIFDEEEYINSLLDIQDYRFGAFAIEIQNKDFIFVGSNYDDFNIKYYLNLYASTTFTSARGRLFFVNPYPDLIFESEIEKVNGILIKNTTEEFAQLLETIVVSKDAVDTKKLKSDGYLLLQNEKQETHLKAKSIYNSDLFIGSHPKWEDIFFEWDIRIPVLEKEILDNISEFESKKDLTMVYSVVGKGYSGKSVVLKRISNILLENGYEVISFEGKSFNSNRVLDYIRETSHTKYALIIDDGSYYYNQIEYIVNKIKEVEKLIILTSSRPYFHSKRKYSLMNSYYREFKLNVKISDSLSSTILSKIDNKGYLGVLSKLSTEQERLSFIKSGKDIASVMFEITNGKKFQTRFKKDTNNIIKTGQFREVLIKLALFDKLELPYFPKELLVNIYKNKTVGIIQRIDDVIRRSTDKTRFNLKNYYITELILKESSSKEITNNLKEILIHISPYVENTSSSYWNEIQSVLMRDKLLRKKLKISQYSLKNMLYELRSYYSMNYNYWLQLGIAEQIDGDYEKALNHFIQAEAYGPKSYMVKNAIGKNFILQSIKEENVEFSKQLFFKGKEILFDLIGTKEEFQVKAYSIHSYINGLIQFYKKNKKLKISRKEINEAQLLLQKMLDKDVDDPLFNSVNSKFTRFLIKANSGNLSMDLEKLQVIHENGDSDELEDELWD